MDTTRISALALAALLGWMAPAPAAAQDVERLPITVSGRQMSVVKPRGWVAGRAPRGSVALFQVAGDPTSQIEIKATHGFEPEQHKSYSSAFHASLIKAGFKPSGRTPPELTNAALPGGQIFTYEVTSDQRDFVMIIWEAHANETTWQVVGFFPVEAWESTVDPLAIIVAGLVPPAQPIPGPPPPKPKESPKVNQPGNANQLKQPGQLDGSTVPERSTTPTAPPTTTAP